MYPLTHIFKITDIRKITNKGFERVTFFFRVW